MNKLATNYPTWGDGTVGGRDAERRGKGGSGEVGRGEAKEEWQEEAGELVVEDRGAIYGGGGAVGLERRRLLSICEL